MCPSPRFNNYQVMANPISSISAPTSASDYSETNPRHHIISTVNMSECISKYKDSKKKHNTIITSKKINNNSIISNIQSVFIFL